MALSVEKIQSDLVAAMKAREQAKTLVLRMLVSAIKNRQIEARDRGAAGEELVLQALKSEIKKRRDAAEAYCLGARPELAANEEAEIAVLSAYLPAQLGESEIRRIAAAAAAAAGENAGFGAVMGRVMAETKGQADGALVSRIVKEILG